MAAPTDRRRAESPCQHGAVHMGTQRRFSALQDSVMQLRVERTRVAMARSVRVLTHSGRKRRQPIPSGSVWQSRQLPLLRGRAFSRHHKRRRPIGGMRTVWALARHQSWPGVPGIATPLRQRIAISTPSVFRVLGGQSYAGDGGAQKASGLRRGLRRRDGAFSGTEALTTCARLGGHRVGRREVKPDADLIAFTPSDFAIGLQAVEFDITRRCEGHLSIPLPANERRLRRDRAPSIAAPKTRSLEAMTPDLRTRLRRFDRLSGCVIERHSPS